MTEEARRFPLVWSAAYEVDIGRHVFPTSKYRLVREALLECRKKGIEVILATGKTMDSIEHLVKELDLKLGLVSDCSNELPDAWDETAFAPHFDATVFSCRQGTKKPELAMYKAVCDQLKVVQEKCLYIGDGGSNELTGARSAGMHPVLLFDLEEAKNPDTHRVEGEEWNGNRINLLSEVLGFLY